MDSTGKSLIVLSALTVAALTFYGSERFYAGQGSGPDAQSQLAQVQADPVQTAAALATAKTAQETDAEKLQALLKGQNAAALAAAEAAAASADSALDSAFAAEYSQAYDAIYNKTDVLFSNATSSGPTINIYTGSAAIQADINAKRQEISGLLNSWKPADAPVVAAYLNQLETIVQSLTPENSGLTEDQIESYEATVEQAEQQVNQAIANVASAQQAVNLANDEVAVQEAAGNPLAIQQAEDAVEQDQANVAALEAQLAAEEAAQGNSSDDSATDTDSGDSGVGNPPNAGNNPGSYTYGTGNVQQQQAQFQEIIKNGPPELLNF